MSGGARKGADTDQLGGRLAAEDFAAVCYFRGKVMATEKENNDSNSGIKVAEKKLKQMWVGGRWGSIQYISR